MESVLLGPSHLFEWVSSLTSEFIASLSNCSIYQYCVNEESPSPDLPPANGSADKLKCVTLKGGLGIA